MDAGRVCSCRGMALVAALLLADAPVAAQPAGRAPPAGNVQDRLCLTVGMCAQQATGDPLLRQGFGLRLAGVKHLDGDPRRPRLPGANPAPPANQPPSAAGLVELANAVLLQGQLEPARERLEEAAARLRTQPDPQAQAALSNAQGALAALQGRYPEARERLLAALQAYTALQAAPAAPAGGTSAADLMAQAQRFAGLPIDPQVAQAAAAQLGAVAAQMEGRFATFGVVRTRLNLANLAGQMGQYQEAEDWLKQALNGLPKQGAEAETRMVLAEFVVLYQRAGRTDQAQAFRQRAEGAGPHRPSGLDTGLVALGNAAATGAPSEATAEGEQQRPSHYAEAAHARLQAQAQERERAGDRPGALAAQGRIAMLAATVAIPEREQAALAAIERLLAADGRAAPAIFFGKRAVNAAQRLRTELGTMDRAARQAYLADKKRSYATLASLLLQHDRLAEAEQVLRLLKEDEGQQLRPTAAAAPRGRVPYTATEADWLVKYDAIAQRTRALEAERRRLQSVAFNSGAIDGRVQQEKFWREQIGVADGLAAQLEQQIGNPRQRREVDAVRTAIAKPAGMRSADEQRQIGRAQASRRLFFGYLDNQAAGLRALRRDGPAFVEPLSADEQRRIDAALARLAAVRARLEGETAFLAAEPEPAGASVAGGAEALDMLSGGAQRRHWAIDRELEQLDAQREALDAGLAAGLAAARATSEPAFSAADTALLDTGPKLLASLPRGAVALYFLAGEQQLDVLLVRRDGRQALQLPVARAALEEQVRALRAALQNPRSDAVAPARALYELLFARLEPALQAAQASTLMLSLDGQLRYLPFASLHDGRGWLAERYAIGLYTTAAPAALAAAPAPRWRVAAFGSSAGGAGLAPLPAVRGELEGVVGDPAAGSRGVLPGTIRLDRGFTAAALRGALREKFNVVHIASHFAFQPGDPNESFLLLGDGGRLTLAELAAPEYRFDRVDLVTLSACDTALSGADAFGQEVEGLGMLLQGQGAAAVLATLWSVADASTAQFMRSLYTLREQQRLSRAQALRDAQLAMIRGAGGPADGTQRGASRQAEGSAAADPSRPYAHPYYWAPFVLMGNWL